MSTGAGRRPSDEAAEGRGTGIGQKEGERRRKKTDIKGYYD